MAIMEILAIMAIMAGHIGYTITNTYRLLSIFPNFLVLL